MPQSSWVRLTVRAVVPGATYEDRVFDQNIRVEAPDGSVLELFDMSPMVAEGLVPGAVGQALLAVDPHTGFTSGGTDGTIVLAPSLTPDVVVDAAVRPEITQRRWAALSYRGVVPLLVPDHVVQGLGAGRPVTWQEGTFVLLGWGPL